MSAYYNENDENKAAWLRELIRSGVVTPGEVDTRPIKDVWPEDLDGFTQCHFFAGIGVWSYALRLAGWPDDRPVWTGSCPCPSFSAAGKGGGFNDPRHLWPDWARLVRKRRPATIFGEQADDAIGYGWLDLVQTDLERENYAVGKAVLGACSVGAPHIRQRLYFVAKSLREPGERGTGSISGAEAESGGEGFADGRFPDGPADGREVVSMANSNGRQSSDGDVQRSGEHGQRQEDGLAGVVADTERNRRLDGRRTGEERDTSATGHQASIGSGVLSETQGLRLTDELGDSAQRGFGVRGSAPGDSGRLAFTEPSGVAMGDTKRKGLEGHAGDGRDGNESGWLGEDAARPVAEASILGGFWRDAEWLWCRDGKYRPVEPGTFPLVTGASNRVLKLRGYGDAICAEVAKAFIEACQEVIHA